MYCQPLLSFGNSDISKLYKQGKLQTVKYGLYGGQLNVDNCTREHIKPKSQGDREQKKISRLQRQRIIKLEAIDL